MNRLCLTWIALNSLTIERTLEQGQESLKNQSTKINDSGFLARALKSHVTEPLQVLVTLGVKQKWFKRVLCSICIFCCDFFFHGNPFYESRSVVLCLQFDIITTICNVELCCSRDSSLLSSICLFPAWIFFWKGNFVLSVNYMLMQ